MLILQGLYNANNSRALIPHVNMGLRNDEVYLKSLEIPQSGQEIVVE